MINIPADTFKLAHQSLLKLNKYEGLFTMINMMYHK